MKNLQEILLSRRSVRLFSDRPVTDEEITAVLEAARVAPSSNNTQPWRFIVVREKETIEKLAKAVPAGLNVINRWLSKAPCIIVCCGDPNPIYHRAAEKALPADLLIIDVTIATEHIVLAAAEFGLGTCWIGWVSDKRTKKLLNLPRKWRVIAMLAVGWPEKPLEPRELKRKTLREIAFKETPEKPWDSND